MRDLCIPVPGICDGKQADVFVIVGNQKIEYHFRVESFPWEFNDARQIKKRSGNEKKLEQIKKLKKAISEYDKDWELVQIFDVRLNAKFVQALYRKKN